MTSLAQIGPELGFGGRAHVFEATTIDANPIALKVYHAKPFCRRELGVYEYLKKLRRYPNYLPQYHGPISLTPDHIRIIESSIYNAHGDTAATIYRIGAGIERVEGPCLSKLVNNMGDRELKSFEEEILAAFLDLHKKGICHKDIKADNILLPPPCTSRINRFVIIDFSESIIQKGTLDTTWEKACKEDTQAIREIFRDARSAKAILVGSKLIQEATSISQPPSTSNTEITNCLSDGLQIQLSHLLASAQFDKSVSLLIDKILSTVKHPICELSLALIRALRCIGRFSDALRVLDNYVTASSDRLDSAFMPSFDFQRAKILQSLGYGSIQHFNTALIGFRAKLGAHHIITQSCRYELALQHARSGDIVTAQNILADLKASFASNTSRTIREDRLFQKMQRLRLPTYTPKSGSKRQKRPATASNTEASPSAKRSRRSRER